MTAFALIFKGLRFKPLRSFLLLSGFSVGVMVMTVLLSVGSAIVVQSRDKDLVGGGDVVVLPAGIDVGVMKTGGVTGKFFELPNARYLTRTFLSRPDHGIAAVSPEITGVQGSLVAGAESYPIEVTGVIPSRYRAVHPGIPERFGDSADDVRYIAAPFPEVIRETDRFHPVRSQPGDTWAEWHYFNFVDADRDAYGYVSLSVIAENPSGDDPSYTRGVVLFEVRIGDGRKTRIVEEFAPSDIAVSHGSPDLQVGPNRVEFDGERYRVSVDVQGDAGEVSAELTFRPDPARYIPPLTAPDDTRSMGYAVPIVRGEAAGVVHVRARTDTLTAVGYHDHNWGFFREGVWDWGIVRAGEWDVLYGRFTQSPGRLAREPLLVAVFDGAGPLLFTPSARLETTWGVAHPTGAPRPRRVTLGFEDPDDWLAIEIEVADVTASDLTAGDEGGGPLRLFYQMRGDARLRGSIFGRDLEARGQAFAETFDLSR